MSQTAPDSAKPISASPTGADLPSSDHKRLKVLLIAPYFDKNVAGESWSTFKWVEGISRYHDVTVLTTHKKEWDQSKSPTQAKRVVNWTFHALPKPLGRLERELKPSYARFFFRARRWIKRAIAAGEQFDLIHQINPLALRYPCPALGLGIKYIMGPLAGSLQTPEGFRSEASDKQWYRKLRNLDSWRIKNDPWLRKSYSEAEIVIGVAPYVEEILRPINIRRFEIASETGVETVTGKIKEPPENGETIRLLFVGRIIRTKGVIDAIRAVAKASETCNLRFDVIGDGDMRKICEEESKRLGADNTIFFHGRIPRDQVDGWYRKAHAFLFPSFREPSGNVVFEAMGFGLPVITSTNGGPGYLVNENCGWLVRPETPESYAHKISEVLQQIDKDRHSIEHYSSASLSRITQTGLWANKISEINRIYLSTTSGVQNRFSKVAN